jgi:hypothetical protein
MMEAKPTIGEEEVATHTPYPKSRVRGALWRIIGMAASRFDRLPSVVKGVMCDRSDSVAPQRRAWAARRQNATLSQNPTSRLRLALISKMVM